MTCLRVSVTGAGGLLGFHVRALLLARNGERLFKGEQPSYTVDEASREEFRDPDALARCVRGSDVVLHLAGINRAEPSEVEGGNERIADALVRALEAVDSSAHVVYANSTHAAGDSPYGRGKRRAAEKLGAWARRGSGRFTSVVLPHIFGEGGRTDYNTVTATLCNRVARGIAPEIHAGAAVELLHAGTAAEFMLECALTKQEGEVRMAGEQIAVDELYLRIKNIGDAMKADVFPDVTDPLELRLYNTYRYARFPEPFPLSLGLHVDERGRLFEAARGGGNGQTFLSWTHPGIQRGDHFHRRKVERFVVVEGQADIKIRRIFDDRVHVYSVNGSEPMAVDMPTLHTHSIVNTGDTPLLTLFWAHEIFDPKDPDTFMHPVIEDGVRGQ